MNKNIILTKKSEYLSPLGVGGIISREGYLRIVNDYFFLELPMKEFGVYFGVAYNNNYLESSQLGNVVYVDCSKNDNLLFQYNCFKEQLLSEEGGYLYLIKTGDYFKIGVSKNFDNRVRSYKTESPHPFDVVFSVYIQGYINVERLIKDKFSHKNHRGEWFNFSNRDLRIILRSLYSDEMNLYKAWGYIENVHNDVDIFNTSLINI